MKVIRKGIVEQPGLIWDPHKETMFSKLQPDQYGRLTLGKGSYFITHIRRTKPYTRSILLPWLKAQDEIYFCVEGIPTTVPPIHDFPSMQKMEEHALFSSEQMELLAKEKETGMYLHSTPNWIMLLAGIGLGGMVTAIAMYALSKWKG